MSTYRKNFMISINRNTGKAHVSVSVDGDIKRDYIPSMTSLERLERIIIKGTVKAYPRFFQSVISPKETRMNVFVYPK